MIQRLGVRGKAKLRNLTMGEEIRIPIATVPPPWEGPKPVPVPKVPPPWEGPKPVPVPKVPPPWEGPKPVPVPKVPPPLNK